MTRITILTKLRFIAALAPLLSIVAAPAVAMGLFVLGAMPTVLNRHEIQGIRAANGMQLALYKMDWGRYQPEGGEIVRDQQRRFVSWIAVARANIETKEQYDAIERIGKTADPIFAAMRKAAPGDQSFEPDLVKLEEMVGELSNADDAVMADVASRSTTRASILILITAFAFFILPWGCYIILSRMCGGAYTTLREIRHRIENLAERAGEPDADMRALDELMAELGFPKPNPMLAEQ